MKKIVAILVLGLLFGSACFGQRLYSYQNLNQASVEELSNYLQKAEKLKKTGTIFVIGGPISSIAGIAMFSASWAGSFGNSFTAGTGLIMFLGGIGLTAVGIPVAITGSSRIKKINSIKNTAFNTVNFNLQPCAHYHALTQNYNPGISLKINF